MSTGSNIEWTDATWVVTTGCTEASSGCANCYARVMSKRIAGMAAADLAKGKDAGKKAAYSLSIRDDGRWSGIVTPIPEAVSEPLRWRTPRRIFVNSMSDLFWGTERDLAEARRRGVKDPKPVPFEFIDRVFAVMALCPRHTFQVLTKRPERMVEYLGDDPTALCTRWHEAQKAVVGYDHPKRNGVNLSDLPFRNVWLGTSVENQATADERIPHLLRCPAAIRFISVEPLLGPVDLARVGGRREVRAYGSKVAIIPLEPHGGPEPHEHSEYVQWVIVGGESGPHARPCDVAWVRSVVEQCRAAGVPVFCKQLGAKPYEDQGHESEETTGRRVYLKLADKKGGAMPDWPTDLRVREMP